MSKKNLLEKSYNFKEIEESLLNSLGSKDFEFRKPSFCITIPPPNITGSLHMGHTLNSTIQDFLIRYNLLKGFNVFWFIGTDHAGIATQNVVEKQLLKDGIKRSDLTKQEFLQKIWEWRNQYGNIILQQFKRLGLYVNTDKARFTMDEIYSKAVKKAFVELYKKGYVYKGKRVVNWCPRCLTSLSDLEVVHKQTDTKLYYVKYKLVDEDGFMVVATTRPETILADTAIAVNPSDSRYSKYIGKNVEVPLVKRIVPVIASEEVDMEFGTGALKITPAHDFNDYKIFLKNKNIKIINIFNTRAQIVIDELEKNDDVIAYEGLDRYQAREKIIRDLSRLELLEKIEDYTTNIGYCYRCDTAIEPFYSDQWFISMKELVKKPRQVVENEEIKFYPSTYKKVVIDWYDNIDDWCVSRQILWGHRIPVYTCLSCGHREASEDEITKCSSCGSSDVKQEEDVLDTWFSSALWPFAVMYWPDPKFENFKNYFYPTDVLTTAREIVFLWVSRMIVMSMFFLNQIPFRDVIIHAVILAPSGKRMSKSLGTGIDPLELVEKYGADAVRMGIIIQTAESQDVKFSYEKIEMARNFLNKLWNAIRYFQIKKEQLESKSSFTNETIKIINSWLEYSTYNLVNKLDNYAQNYKFFDYSMSLYYFVWNIFCDWYIEFSKFVSYRDIQENVERTLKIILLYLHPIIPFFTTYLYKQLFDKNIMEERFPDSLSNGNENDYILIQNLIDSIKEVRSIVNEVAQISKKDKVKVKIDIANPDLKNIFHYFTKTVDDVDDKYFIVKTKIGNAYIYISNQDSILFKQFLHNKVNELNTNIKKIENLLSNRDFINKADKNVVLNYRENLNKYREMLTLNETIIKELS